jgi:hypothetical protein
LALHVKRSTHAGNAECLLREIDRSVLSSLHDLFESLSANSKFPVIWQIRVAKAIKLLLNLLDMARKSQKRQEQLVDPFLKTVQKKLI